MQKIDSFDGEYRFLSNFYMSAIKVKGSALNKVLKTTNFLPDKLYEFDCTERAYHYCKFTKKADRKAVLDHPFKGLKKFQKELQSLRRNWDVLKLPLMRLLVRIKFEQNSYLAKKLKATNKKELIEGNWWGDIFFGVCKGEGKNHLGKILMKVRKEL